MNKWMVLYKTEYEDFFEIYNTYIEAKNIFDNAKLELNNLGFEDEQADVYLSEILEAKGVLA